MLELRGVINRSSQGPPLLPVGGSAVGEEGRGDEGANAPAAPDLERSLVFPYSASFPSNTVTACPPSSTLSPPSRSASTRTRSTPPRAEAW
jgi:hypothetical protein